MRVSRIAAIASAAIVLLLCASTLAAAAVYGPAAPTRPQYVAKAEQICAKSTKKINKLTAAEKFGPASKAFGKHVGALGSLPRPSADQALLGRWVKSMRIDASNFRKLAKALVAEDIAAARKSAKAAAHHAPLTNAIVGGFGFRNCLIKFS